MKGNACFAALCCVALSLTGCIEENFESIRGKSGDGIVFGVVGGFENNSPETKTTYTGKYYYVNSQGEVSAEKPSGDNYRRFEYVNWIEGDKVLINCDQGDQTAHYTVTGNNIQEGELEKMILEGVDHNGIQWQDMTKPHTFYAIYPSPYQFDMPDDHTMLDRYKDRIKVVGSDLYCYLPVSQTPVSVTAEDGKNWVAEPNMDLAYMIAKTTVGPEEGGGGVLLNFRPIVTALEITMSFPTVPEGGITPDDGNAGTDDEFTGWEDVTLSNVQVMTVDGSPITGSFSMNLENYTHAENVDYPEVTFVDEPGEDLDAISVQLWDADGKPISITKGGSVKFTVFLRPEQIRLDNLAVRINMGGVFRTAQIGKTPVGEDLPVYVEAHKKQYIIGITLPATPTVNNSPKEVTGSNWVSQLDPATYLGGLSIPGTANSFSYNYSTSIDNNYMTQTVSFEDQWNIGVRCFELVSDRCGSDYSSGEDNGRGNLGEQNLRCNNQSLGLTVRQAFDLIVDKVQNSPGEFAMVIMTYQPRGGVYASRNPEYYMSVLKNFYLGYQTPDGKSLSDITSIYQPGLRVADLKSKPIMIVARPSQEGEDSETSVTNAQAPDCHILTVKGWGSLVDKWYKRGYNTQLFKGSISSTGGYGNKTDLLYPSLDAMEDYIYGETGTGDFPKDENGAYIPYPEKGTQRFEYVSDQGFSVWAQEWRRVSAADNTFNGKYGIGYANYTARWFESFNEKKSDVTDCLARSIVSEANRVYFNSLDGFYIIDDADSCFYYWRGNMGNIGDFAEDINEWFYPVLQQYSAADVTGPLGVIILDRVSSQSGSAGNLLPQTIIQNNFMFSVPKDPSLSVINGGNAI